MIERITSVHNPKIKNIVKLQQKSSERKKQNLIVIEGLRELDLAVRSGMILKSLFICTEIIPYEYIENELKSEIQSFEITKEVFEKIAYRGSTEGVIALAEPLVIQLNDLVLRKNPLIIVLESIEKPGNLGAILRTADAAKVDAVIICDPLTDIYNPNVIRSSIGCVFTNQVVACSSDETIVWLKEKGIKSYAAALTAKELYHETDFKGATAIVMGTEADGLTDKWLNGADEQIIIPMSGEIDSLNVSTSTAILVFEAMRQRNFYK
ncbi:MAG: RNA methyltransferase [Bacteroidales bacterium]|jgi:TrmH family RNA methyltransferase|nr:RNA methyltransferase [Bacteroidales bacterium]